MDFWTGAQTGAGSPWRFRRRPQACSATKAAKEVACGRSRRKGRSDFAACLRRLAARGIRGHGAARGATQALMSAEQPVDKRWPVPDVIDSLLRAALPAELHGLVPRLVVEV